MSQVNTAMQTLTAQWYNAMVTGLGLDRNQFQLYQGNNSMDYTSIAMWNRFNAVPPASLNSYYDPNQGNSFAAAFNLVLNALVATPDTNFQTCLEDYYSQWITYFAANDPKTWDAKGVSDLFTRWAMKNVPSKATCVTALTKMYTNPINVANNMFASAGTSFAWNKTIDALQAALAGGGSKTFTMDSSTSSSDVKHTWANGSISFFYNIFSFGGGGSYDDLSVKTTSAGLKVDATFDKVTTFAAGPYAQTDTDNPVFNTYKPWYYSAVLALAYTTKDNTVWNNQSSTTWVTAFGSKGFLQRMLTALVVADGVTITMTSSASYNSSEQQQITAAAKVGIWPFFSSSAQGGTTTTVTFDDSGSFTSTTTIPRGNPQVLGILQSSLADIF
jgi:hypothetical protein